MLSFTIQHPHPAFFNSISLQYHYLLFFHTINYTMEFTQHSSMVLLSSIIISHSFTALPMQQTLRTQYHISQHSFTVSPFSIITHRFLLIVLSQYHYSADSIQPPFYSILFTASLFNIAHRRAFTYYSFAASLILRLYPASFHSIIVQRIF
ncbi:hypothetical protein BD289DRAFT_433479 [Coniella lustricola]|uniref:Uncharacterized protein n=1 Tax=Coniella lustricola TaxID=2025994 RepID=A0A2T3A8F8_9PEZI|nr:hypothetical protein BD289DRAFT_433479 [Coniella lustricola]